MTEQQLLDTFSCILVLTDIARMDAGENNALGMIDTICLQTRSKIEREWC